MPFTSVQDKPFHKLLDCYIAKLLKEKQFNNSTIQQFNNGFSLVEILLSLFLLSSLLAILFSTTGSLFTRRTSDLQAIATKIASRDIENQRNTPFGSLPATTIGGCDYTFPDADLSKLHTKYGNGCVTRTRTDYGSDPNIQWVTVTVNWRTDNGAAQTVQMDTLIYKNGL